jgi:hypothetical protein
VKNSVGQMHQLLANGTIKAAAEKRIGRYVSEIKDYF